MQKRKIEKRKKLSCDSSPRQANTSPKEPQEPRGSSEMSQMGEGGHALSLGHIWRPYRLERSYIPPIKWTWLQARQCQKRADRFSIPAQTSGQDTTGPSQAPNLCSLSLLALCFNTMESQEELGRGSKWELRQKVSLCGWLGLCEARQPGTHGTARSYPKDCRSGEACLSQRKKRLK